MELDFTYNWNNKLACTCYSTIRASGRLREGQHVTIKLQGKPLHVAMVEVVKPFRIHEMTEAMAMIDTGYGRDETIQILRKMYSKLTDEQFEKQLFHFYVLRALRPKQTVSR